MGATYNLARTAQLATPVVVGLAVARYGLAGGLGGPVRARAGDRVVGLGATRDARHRAASPVVDGARTTGYNDT